MKLTVGMATYKDFDGVYFTLAALRMYQSVSHQLELLVVDNLGEPNPEGVGCPSTKKVTRDFRGRYIHAPHAKGTAAPRDLVFKEATGDVVMCIDCHVLPEQGTLDRLAAFFADPAHAKDLVQGPMLADDMQTLSSHFDPVWRQRMYGTWACDDLVKGTEPFEIPMQGLGMFAMRKEAWPGFNPLFRGFGGEEGYIHEKVRQRGGRCYCHPGMRWLHRFGRPGGVPYPMKVADRIANYIIGRMELGLGYADVLDHFKSIGDANAVAEAVKLVDGYGVTPATTAVAVNDPKGWPKPSALDLDVTPVEPPDEPEFKSGVPASPPEVSVPDTVSCLCATFGRGQTQFQILLEEAIESFNRQTYRHKELVIVNDDPTQTIAPVKIPGVVVLNLPRRFPGLGEKWNFIASMAGGNILTLWDDDDISLPWRLELCRDLLGDKDYLNPRSEWFLKREGLVHNHPQNNCFHSAMFTRKALSAIRGFAYNSTDNDSDAAARMLSAGQRKLIDVVPYSPLPIEQWYYLYRWGVSDHLSAGYAGNERWARLGRAVRPAGEFTVAPKWKTDYVRMVAERVLAINSGEVKG